LISQVDWITRQSSIKIARSALKKHTSEVLHKNALYEFAVVIVDRVAGEIIRFVASVCVLVCPFAVGTLPFEPFDL